MSEMNEKDPKSTKKKLQISKDVIEELKDEDLDQVAGGLAIPPTFYPRNDFVET